MRITFAVALVLAVAANAMPSEPEKARIAVALAEAEYASATAASACHTDLRVAKAVAARDGRPLVLWVGVRCCDSPEIRDGLSGAVHCHQDSYAGSDSPRLVVVKDGRAVGDWPAASLTGKQLPEIRKATSRMDWFF